MWSWESTCWSKSVSTTMEFLRNGLLWAGCMIINVLIWCIISWIQIHVMLLYVYITWIICIFLSYANMLLMMLIWMIVIKNELRNLRPTQSLIIYTTLWKLSYAPRVRPFSSWKVEYVSALNYIGLVLNTFHIPQACNIANNCSKFQVMSSIVFIMVFPFPWLVTYYMIILHDKSTKSFNACICAYNKIFVWIYNFQN